MKKRHAALSDLLEGLKRIFIVRQTDPSLKAEVITVFAALESPGEEGSSSPGMIDACRHLAPALSTANVSRDADVRAVASVFAELAPLLSWLRRKGSEVAGEPFHSCHANAMIVGPGGLESLGNVWLGVSLMGPQTQYPMHRHPPNELYIVLSDGDWFREGDGWFTPTSGGLVFNPPNAVHSMRAGEAPLLAFWLLWSNDGVAL